MRSLRIAGWSAIGAGIAGLVALVSALPWPQLFGLDAAPDRAVLLDPGLLPVLAVHYGVLAVGAALGVVVGGFQFWGLRSRPLAAAAALAVTGGTAVFLYAAATKAVAVTIAPASSVPDGSSVVFLGGVFFLIGVGALSLLLRRFAGRGFFLLGIAGPLLVVGGILAFVVLGPDFYPVIWGVTIPPPTDYSLRSGSCCWAGRCSTALGLGKRRPREARSRLLPKATGDRRADRRFSAGGAD